MEVSSVVPWVRAGVVARAHELRELVGSAESGELESAVPVIAGVLAEAFARLRVRAIASQPETERGKIARDTLRPEDVAARLGLPLSKVYHLLRVRHLRGAKVGKYWVIPSDALDGYLRQHMAA